MVKNITLDRSHAKFEFWVHHLAIHSVTIMCHLLPGSVRGTEMPCGQKAPALVGRDRYGASCEYGVVRAVMEVNTGSCRSTYQGPLALR